MEDFVLGDLDIGWAGGGVPGVMVRHLGVGGVDTGLAGPRVFLPVNLPGGDGRHRGQRPHRRTPRQLQGFRLSSGWGRQPFLQGEEGGLAGLDTFLGHEGIFISRTLRRLPFTEFLYLGRGVEIELVWPELAGTALDLVEEFHRDGKYVGLRRS